MRGTSTLTFAKKWEESQDQEVNHQVGKKSQPDIVADDNTPGAVFEEEKQQEQETLGASEEDNGENWHHQVKEKNMVRD